MIVTVTYKGEPFSPPMRNLRDDNLLSFIKTEMELGREVHIEPEPWDLWPPKKAPQPQTAPRQWMEPCRTCFWYENGLCLLEAGREYLKPKQPDDSCGFDGGASHGTEE